MSFFPFFSILFYFYGNLLISKLKTTRYNYIIYLIPVVLFIVNLCPFFFSSRVKHFNLFHIVYHQKKPLGILVFQLFVYTERCFKLFSLINKIEVYPENLKRDFLNIDSLIAKWFRKVTIFTYSAFVSFVITFALYFLNNEFLLLNDIFFSLSSAFFMIFHGHVAMKQYEIFKLTKYISCKLLKNYSDTEQASFDERFNSTNADRNIKINKSLSGTEELKYQNSLLSSKDSIRYFEKIKDLMQEKKLYANSEFFLSDLAAELSISRTYVSQVINENAGKNFYDFINQYRVDEVKKNLGKENKAHYSILDLALLAGFNSKSSFNNAFKKFTGLTPSEYKRIFVEKFA